MVSERSAQRIGRVAAALSALLLLIPSSTAASSFGLTSSVGAATIAPPVTLAAGNNCNGQCTTTLNAVATSATVGTLNILPNPSQQRQVVKVIHGAQPWSVQVRVAAVSSLVAADSVTLGVVGTSSAFVTVNSATTLPATSTAVPLAGGAGAADLTLTARGTCAATCTVTAELLLSSGKITYAYTVTVTVT